MYNIIEFSYIEKLPWRVPRIIIIKNYVLLEILPIDRAENKVRIFSVQYIRT